MSGADIIDMTLSATVNTPSAVLAMLPQYGQVSLLLLSVSLPMLPPTIERKRDWNTAPQDGQCAGNGVEDIFILLTL